MTLIAPDIPAAFHKVLTFPGWWHRAGDKHLAHVRPCGRRFVATVYANPDEGPFGPPRLYQGRSIIGTYPTISAAVDAACILVAHDDSPRLCKISDIDKVRRQFPELHAPSLPL